MIKTSNNKLKIKAVSQEKAVQIDNQTQQNPKDDPLKSFLKNKSSILYKTMQALNKKSAINSTIIQAEVNAQLQAKRQEQMNEHLHRDNNKQKTLKKILKQSKQINNLLKTQNRKQVKMSFRKSKQEIKQQSKFQNCKINLEDFIDIKHQNIDDLYIFQQLLGEGAFGQVFKAIDKKTEEIRAIKALKNKLMTKKNLEAFFEQIDLLKKLSHPSIIKIYDLYLNDHKYFLVMEYCKGGSIQKSRGKFTFKSEIYTAKIIKQTLSALNYIHSLKIVHRDIKLQNIVFLDDNNNLNEADIAIKIIDFGSATKMKYKIQHNHTIEGTYCYMAPQVLKGVLTQKSDIWSLGIMMIFMLTGINPFHGANQAQTIKKIKQKNINFNQKPYTLISQPAKNLLSKMLQTSYHKRITAKQALQHPWLGGDNHNTVQSISSNVFDKQYHNNNFVAIIQSYLALNKLSQKERQLIANTFNSIDRDNDGFIETSQLKDSLLKKNPDLSQQQLARIINFIDKNKSGKIEFDQFIIASSDRDTLFIKQYLSEAFDHFDADKTGFLQKKEIKLLLKRCSASEVQFFLGKLDQDNDHKVSKEQFIQYLINY